MEAMEEKVGKMSRMVVNVLWEFSQFEEEEEWRTQITDEIIEIDDLELLGLAQLYD
jgi:hypothetical protein